MDNSTIQIKIKQRLNKMSSQDFENLECWQMAEAFNKAQIEWCRRNLHGGNQYREGDEQSLSRIDDLQVLVTDLPLSFTDKGIYFQSTDWPTDYLRFNRINLFVKSTCCDKSSRMNVWLGVEANVDTYLSDVNLRPNYGWRETFGIISGNTVKIYHEKQFNIDTCSLLYYRAPRRIAIEGCKDVYTNDLSTEEITCELKEDLVELIIDEAAKILSGDMENVFQVQRNQQSTETNN